MMRKGMFNRGSSLLEQSHDLLAQFWRIGVMMDRDSVLDSRIQQLLVSIGG